MIREIEIPKMVHVLWSIDQHTLNKNIGTHCNKTMKKWEACVGYFLTLLVLSLSWQKISIEKKNANTGKVSTLLIIEEDEYEEYIIKNN